MEKEKTPARNASHSDAGGKKLTSIVKELKEIKKSVPVSVENEMDNIVPEAIEKELSSKPDRYFEAIGRRKTAVARVRLFTRGEKQFLVNGKPYQEYFTLGHDQQTVTSSMRKMKCLDKFKVTVVVTGGGRNAQAEAVRHGTGARGLRAILEETLLELMYGFAGGETPREVVITREMIKRKSVIAPVVMKRVG